MEGNAHGKRAAISVSAGQLTWWIFPKVKTETVNYTQFQPEIFVYIMSQNRLDNMPVQSEYVTTERENKENGGNAHEEIKQKRTGEPGGDRKIAHLPGRGPRESGNPRQ